MMPEEWLRTFAELVQKRLPDSDVDDVENGCLEICRGHVALAMSAAHGQVLAVACLGRGSEGPWTADRVAHEGHLLFDLSGAVMEAADRVVSLLI